MHMAGSYPQDGKAKDCADLQCCLQSMWLIGGETWAPYELVEEVPEVAQHKPVHISQDAFLSNGSSEAPSTGFIGALLC